MMTMKACACAPHDARSSSRRAERPRERRRSERGSRADGPGGGARTDVAVADVRLLEPAVQLELLVVRALLVFFDLLRGGEEFFFRDWHFRCVYLRVRAWGYYARARYPLFRFEAILWGKHEEKISSFYLNLSLVLLHISITLARAIDTKT